MNSEKNGMALTGFIVSLCALLPTAAMVAPGLIAWPLDLICAAAALAVAATGLVFSAIGHHIAAKRSLRGMRFALSGVIVGTVAATLSLAWFADRFLLALLR